MVFGGDNQLGYRRLRPLKDWTMAHHFHLVDMAIHLGMGMGTVDFERDTQKTMTLVKKLMKSPMMEGLPTSVVLNHVVGFQHQQKQAQHLLDSLSRERVHGENTFHDDFLTSWTLEHHKRFLEAVIQSGGLENAKPKVVVQLMDEERRRGLTAYIVMRHDLGLRHLQKRTQEAILDYVTRDVDTCRRYGPIRAPNLLTKLLN